MFYEGTKLQQAFDNTSISIFKDCPRKYRYSILEGWRATGTAPPLVFGTAYHDCLELFDGLVIKGLSRDDALLQAFTHALELSEEGFGDDNRRTRLTLLRSLVWYADNYVNDPLKTHVFENGRVGLEMSFSFELPFSAEGHREPYVYSGHMDKLAMYNGSLYTVERKHTALTLNQSFFERYFFSSQVGGYVYAGKVVFDTPVAGAIIEATQVAVNFSRFGRSVVHRVNDHLEEWMYDLHYWIKQVEECATAAYWPTNTESCSKYSGCQFRKVCSKPESIRQLILETEFKQDPWNPLKVRGDQ